MSEQGRIIYMEVEQIVRMHDDLIDRHGGSYGVRDMGLVEAAVGRHASGYYENRIEEAAALMESLLMNHPFIDGNKRIAFAGAQVFLGDNGYEIVADSQIVYARIMGLFERQEITHENLVALLSEITSAE